MNRASFLHTLFFSLCVLLLLHAPLLCECVSFSSVAPSAAAVAAQDDSSILDVSNMGITSIAAGDLDIYPSLKHIILRGNALTTIPIGLFNPICCYQVQSVDISSNRLSNGLVTLNSSRWDTLLSVTNTAFRSLDLSNNPLGAIPNDFLFTPPAKGIMLQESPRLSLIMNNCSLKSLGTGLPTTSPLYANKPFAFQLLSFDNNDLGDYSLSTAVSDSSLPTYDTLSPYFVPNFNEMFQLLTVNRFSCNSCNLKTWTPSFEFQAFTGTFGLDLNITYGMQLSNNMLDSTHLTVMTTFLKGRHKNDPLVIDLDLSYNKLTSIAALQFASLSVRNLTLDFNDFSGASALVAGSFGGINFMTGPNGPNDPISFTSEFYGTGVVTLPEVYMIHIDPNNADGRDYFMDVRVSIQNCRVTALPIDLFKWTDPAFAAALPSILPGSWITQFDFSYNPMGSPTAIQEGTFSSMYAADGWPGASASTFPFHIIGRNCSLTNLPGLWFPRPDPTYTTFASNFLGVVDFSGAKFGATGIQSGAFQNIYLEADYQATAHFHYMRIILQNSGITGLPDHVFEESHMLSLDLSFNDLSSTTAFSSFVFSNLGKIFPLNLNVASCGITTIPAFAFDSTLFQVSLDLSGQNLHNLQPFALGKMGSPGLGFNAVSLVNVSNSKITYVPDFLLWNSFISTLDMSYNNMTATKLDSFIKPMDVSLTPPDLGVTPFPPVLAPACDPSSNGLADWPMGDPTVGGLAPFAFATSSTYGRGGHIDYLDLRHSGIRQLTRFSIKANDGAIDNLYAGYNNFSSPTSLTSMASAPSCGVQYSALASTSFVQLDLSNSNIQQLPANVFSYYTSANAGNGDAIINLSGNNFGSRTAIDPLAFQYLFYPNTPGTGNAYGPYIDFSSSNLQYLPPRLFATSSTTRPMDTLDFTSNTFTNSSMLKEALADAPFAAGGQLKLSNCSITSLPTQAFPVRFFGTLNPWFNLVDLSYNRFDAGTIQRKAFTNPYGATSTIQRLDLSNSRLRYTSLAVGVFDNLDVIVLDMSNTLDALPLTNTRNLFNPFPANLFGVGNASMTNVEVIYIGGLRTMPNGLFGAMKPSKLTLTVELNFDPTSFADAEVINALTYTPSMTPPTKELTKALNLRISGWNLFSSSVLPTPCIRPSASIPCFLLPSIFYVPIEPAFVTRNFFSYFAAKGADVPQDQLMQNLTFARPQAFTPYATHQGDDSHFQPLPVPWNPSVTTLPTDLLCDLKDLQNVAVTYGDRIHELPPLLTLPEGFFSCLAQVDAGSLKSIDLTFSYFQGPQNRYLAGMSSGSIIIKVEIFSLYNFNSPVPIGMFDDLDAAATLIPGPTYITRINDGTAPAMSIIVTKCARPMNGVCVACPASTSSSSFKSATGVDLYFCRRCPAGFFCNSQVVYGSRPIGCPAGTYQPDQGSTGCYNCTAGSYQPLVAQNSPAACLLCPAGTSSNVEAATSKVQCVPTKPGTYSSLPGSTDATACPEGKYQDLTGQSTCKPCPANTYSNAVGATNSSTCQNCPGSTTSLPSSTSASQCLSPPCYAGTYKKSSNSIVCDASCPVGYMCLGDGLKTPCSAGSYQDASGASTCLLCSAGTYSSVVAGTNSSICWACPKGTYSQTSGSASCTSCPANTRGTSERATSNATCVTTGCDGSDSICTVGSTDPLDLAKLSSASPLTYFESVDAFQSYVPSRTTRSLRLAAPAFAEDSLLQRLNAGVGGSQSLEASTGILPDASANEVMTTQQITIVIVVLAVATLIPIFLFQYIPECLVRRIDAFATKVLPEPTKGARLSTKKSHWGASFTFAFIPLALLIALMLGTEANVIIQGSLVPAASTQNAGTARSTIQLTVAAYSTASSTSSAANTAWCSSTAMTLATGFSPAPIARAQYNNGVCTVAIDCDQCVMAGVGRVAVSFPYTNQALEWDILTTSAVPNSFSKLSAPLLPIAGSMLDESSVLSFSVLESYYSDNRPGKTTVEASGLQLAFNNYRTITPQNASLVTSDSTVNLEFELLKGDTVYSTSVTPKKSLFGILSNILAVIVSVFGIWQAIYQFSVDRAHRAGFVNFEGQVLADDGSVIDNPEDIAPPLKRTHSRSSLARSPSVGGHKVSIAPASGTREGAGSIELASKKSGPKGILEPVESSDPAADHVPVRSESMALTPNPLTSGARPTSSSFDDEGSDTTPVTKATPTETPVPLPSSIPSPTNPAGGFNKVLAASGPAGSPAPFSYMASGVFPTLRSVGDRNSSADLFRRRTVDEGAASSDAPSSPSVGAVGSLRPTGINRNDASPSKTDSSSSSEAFVRMHALKPTSSSSAAKKYEAASPADEGEN